MVRGGPPPYSPGTHGSVVADDEYELVKRSEGDWVQNTVDNLARLGVPETALRLLPPIAVLFGWGALPAAGVAVMSFLSAGLLGAVKQHKFQQAVMMGIHGEIGDVENRVEALVGATRAMGDEFAEVQRQADELAHRLTPAQIEHLSMLFEQYMGSVDEEWVEFLQNAVRRVAADDADADIRKSVVHRLRGLGPTHARLLLHMVEQARQPSGRYYTAEDKSEEAIIAALDAAGFVSAELNPFGQAPPRCELTRLGVVAAGLLDV